MHPELDDRPLTGGDIGTLHRAINTRIEQAIRVAGFDRVTIAHKPILLSLDQPRRIGELAHLAGVTKNATVYLVNQLEAAGYVERIADPADKRATVVRLTARGLLLGRTVGQELNAMADEWRSVIGAENWATFRLMLRELAHHARAGSAPLATSPGRPPRERN